MFTISKFANGSSENSCNFLIQFYTTSIARKEAIDWTTSPASSMLSVCIIN